MNLTLSDRLLSLTRAGASCHRCGRPAFVVDAGAEPARWGCQVCGREFEYEPPGVDYYAVENTVRVGKYPGTIVSTHDSHWGAVAEIIRLKDGRDA